MAVRTDRDRPAWLGWVCLKGNHEDIMWQCCRQPIKAGWWMENGGGATLISYGQNYGDIVNVKVVPEQHLRWIEELPLMHVDRHLSFTKAIDGDAIDRCAIADEVHRRIDVCAAVRAKRIRRDRHEVTFAHVARELEVHRGIALVDGRRRRIKRDAGVDPLGRNTT